MQAAAFRTRAHLEKCMFVNASGTAIDARPAHWAPFVVIGDGPVMALHATLPSIRECLSRRSARPPGSAENGV